MISKLSNRLELAGASLRFPPAPDLAAAWTHPPRTAPQLRWALAALLVAMVSLLAVPSVRARVLEFLQVGAVRVVLPELSASQKVEHTARKYKLSRPELIIGSVLELDGETTLETARGEVAFPIGLPSYPFGLGEPDKVYVQHTDLGDFVVLAWLDSAGKVELVQYVIGSGVRLNKGEPEVVEVTELNGQLAIWTNSEYLLSIDGYQQPLRFVNNPALIWLDEGVTYRLEGPFDLETMLRIAGSIPRVR
jgi:hypothetical protein